MGFSWSSCVCQEVVLSYCSQAGLSPSKILADDVDTPEDPSDVFVVATDDVVTFNSNSEKTARLTGAALDTAMADHGVEKHAAKDVTACLNGTVIGIDLVDGRYLGPRSGGLLVFVRGALALLRRREASPLQINALIGRPHWYDQLNRPLYAILDHVYKFTRLTPDHIIRRLPGEVLAEIALCVMLSPYWEVDLTREWSSQIASTDASPSFGFGVAVAQSSPAEARRIGRLADCTGAFVRMCEGDDSNCERARAGTCHRLRIGKKNFRTVISCPKKYDAHSGSLEATGVVLWARWLSRSSLHHRKRHAVLVDARAVLGAAARGRTSAPSFCREIRRLAAYSLGCDMLMKYVYVPSESNPADAPSRGKRGRQQVERTKVYSKTKTARGTSV